MATIYRDHVRRYRTWIEALGRLMEELRMLNCAKAPGQKYIIRQEIRRSAREIDRLQVPPGWRSWEQLGDAIHGPKPRPRTW